MSIQTYLIDTNVIIGLEDHRTVQPAFAALLSTASKHKIDVLVHEAARDDIQRDKDVLRRSISLSKLEKFQVLKKVRGLNREDLEKRFGSLPRPNDLVDATLLDSIERGAADFLVTEDRGLHDRARRFSPELFDSLREDYVGFDVWWREKCVKERRPCWGVFDDGLAGLIVRKDENAINTDATIKVPKILKICTFKVRPEKRGVKLGELLLKKAFWFAQANQYDLIYLTTYETQVALIDLLEFYGFRHTATKADGELIYEKQFSREKLESAPGLSSFELDRINYPRFIARPSIRGFGVPIKEAYHDTLYPDLRNPNQADLFDAAGVGLGPKRPGNTIRKVYLCRAQSNLGPPGSLLFFYKGKSANPPSQAFTTIGIFEESSIAASTKDLMRLTGGRSVYSETQLSEWRASSAKPVKVINYLLAAYIEPAISLTELQKIGIIRSHPPQSIFEIGQDNLQNLLDRLKLGFSL